MKDWIFLSKDGQDEYIAMMARAEGACTINTNDFNYESSNSPIVLRGILKHKIMKRCWSDQRDFYYVDTGYFDHWLAMKTQRSNKLWHRVVKNNLQHPVVHARPDDRLKMLGIDLPRRRYGTKILIALPDDKPCKFYGIDRTQWTKDIVDTIKQNTDRPIVLRDRAGSRQDRISQDPLVTVLQNHDIHILVTFNSLAAIESVLCGVPAVVLAPCHAAAPVCDKDLSRVDSPHWPGDDELHSWLCHLSYGQWHVSELKSGRALEYTANEY